MRQYYQIQDPALVLGIENLRYDEPTAKGLRQLYEDGKVLFVLEPEGRGGCRGSPDGRWRR